MKTLTYLPTLLALTIQAMVIGQTQGNQARKIRVDIMGPKEPVKMNYSNSNITISIQEYEQLLEQANNLKIDAKKLREEAVSAETQSIMKSIEASELSGKITLQKFEQTKVIILDLFTKIPKNNISYTKAQGSFTESERFMKIAKEIREEANAQLTIQARYAEMINAEEEETLALAKQEEVLSLFHKDHSQFIAIDQTIVSESTQQTPKPEAVESNVLPASKKNNMTENLLAAAAEQAYEMKMTAQQLRQNALTSSPNQKTVLLNEAISLENDIIAKQVEISLLKSKMNYEKFFENKKAIALLMDDVKDETVLNKAMEVNNEAERLMKIGREMREEANAQFTASAKFGAMSNAEETEIFALGKQQKSMQILDKDSLKAVVASR